MERFSWLLGIRSVGQHSKRNLIAGSAIAVGLIASLFMIGYCAHVSSYLGTAAIYIQQPGHIAVLKKGGLRYRLIEPKKYSLSALEVAAVERIASQNPEISIVSPYLFGAGLVGNGCKSFPFRATGFSPAKEQRVKDSPDLKSIIPEYRTISEGMPLWNSKLTSPVGLSGGLARRLGKSSAGEAVSTDRVFSAADCDIPGIQAQLAKDPNVQLLTQTYDQRLNAIDSNIANEFSTGVALTENNSMQMDIIQLQELLQTSDVSYLGIFLKDPSKTDLIAKRIVSDMKAQGLEVDAFTWDDEEWNPNFIASRNVLLVTQTFISIVVAAVVLLSILNTVNIGLVESRAEIGTLKALGYKPRQIAWIFAIESLCVAVVSLIAGSLLGAGLFHWIKTLQIPLKYPGLSQTSTFQIDPPLWTYFAASALLCSLIVMTCLFIAKRFAQQPTLTLLDRGS